MSSNDNILALAAQVRNFNPEPAERYPSSFLSLAPATSASYPQARRASIKSVDSDKTDVAAATTSTTKETMVDVKERRSSSLSSDSSKASGFRFLKLSPVHWGEHQDDHKLDWHEVAVE